MTGLQPRYSHHAVQVLKSLSQEDPKIQSIFSDLKSQLENASNDLEIITIESLARSPRKENVRSLLRALSNLGKSAEQDLQHFEKCGEDNEIYGFTGVCLKETQENHQYVPDDLFGYKNDPLQEDESLKEAYDLLRQSHTVLTELKDGDKCEDKLVELLKLEDKLMIKVRRHQALCAARLSLPAKDEENVKFQGMLHTLFKETFNHVRCHSSNQPETLSKLIRCAWVWDGGPSLCVMAASTLDNIGLRVYGLDEHEVIKAKVYVRLDSDPKPLQMAQQQVSPKISGEDSGVVLSVPEMSLKGLKAEKRRNPEPQLYRLACKFTVDLCGSCTEFECSSVPFAVRTGSPQLWPYLSHVVWFIWAQQDMREPDQTCPRELELCSIVSLVQAHVIGTGLKLLNKALWDSWKFGEGQGVIAPQQALPHKLTDGERKGWENTFIEKCGLKDSKARKISRQNFTKSSKQTDVNGSDFCPWALVCGAVNTGLRLKELDLDRYYFMGLSGQMCWLLTVKPGDFLLRSSLSTLNNPSGKEPLTSIVLEVCMGHELKPMVSTLEKFENFTLKQLVNGINLDEPGNKGIQWILPDRVDIHHVIEPVRGALKEKKTEKKKSNIEYRDKIRQEELPPETLLQSVESISLESSPGTSPEIKEPVVMACEEDTGEPKSKKNALQGEEKSLTIVDRKGNQSDEMQVVPSQFEAIGSPESIASQSSQPSPANFTSESEDLSDLKILSETDMAYIHNCLLHAPSFEVMNPSDLFDGCDMEH